MSRHPDAARRFLEQLEPRGGRERAVLAAEFSVSGWAARRPLPLRSEGCTPPRALCLRLHVRGLRAPRSRLSPAQHLPLRRSSPLFVSASARGALRAKCTATLEGSHAGRGPRFPGSLRPRPPASALPPPLSPLGPGCVPEPWGSRAVVTQAWDRGGSGRGKRSLEALLRPDVDAPLGHLPAPRPAGPGAPWAKCGLKRLKWPED